MTEKKPDDLERVITFAKDLASPDWCLSVPVAAKTVITNLIAAVEDSKPRTIETVEELDKLPVGSAIIPFGLGAFLRVGVPSFDWIDGDGNMSYSGTLDRFLPATVLYEPGAGE